ncbi:hypothetical protein, partial [Bacillus sp. WP8]|uniref:hypothetical protein n=1 Tax=Bacillus sp. WP8 TaxID=756828 RepID=UPI001C930F27
SAVLEDDGGEKVGKVGLNGWVEKGKRNDNEEDDWIIWMKKEGGFAHGWCGRSMDVCMREFVDKKKGEDEEKCEGSDVK